MKAATLRLSSAIAAAATTALAQGPLTPPGAPAPAFKTLQQVEPRTPISSVPLTITASGSYYLTTNITAGANPGITIATNDVTLDLQGFTLNGSGTGFNGILVSGMRTNITVRNGSISGWTSYGIDARDCYVGRFENLHLVRNNSAGLASGRRGTVLNCLSYSNTLEGFYVGGDSTIQNCLAGYNGQNGIRAFESACRIDGNQLLRNGHNGLYVPNGGNLIIRNGASGNATNYNIFSLNTTGPTNAGPGSMTNHPWANFVH